MTLLWGFVVIFVVLGVAMIAIGRDSWSSKFGYILIGLAGVIAVLASLASRPARAQEHHAQHHDVYESWENRNGEGCCNGRDCGRLQDSDERRDAAGLLEVRVEGQWCPVLPHHYLRKGNVPNAAYSHACVVPDIQYHEYGEAPPEPQHPCKRFRCYQPRPGA